MTIALAICLVLTVAGFLALLDRKDKRHDAQLTRLLVHIQAPQTAVAYAVNIPVDGPLYLPPEDDEAWNTQHRTGDQ